MIRLRQRNRQPELMDAPDLDANDHSRALAGLKRINRISGTPGRLWRRMREIAGRMPGKELRILDIGCGSCDVGFAIARLAERDGVSLTLGGRDISPTAIEMASARAARERVAADFQIADVTKDSLSGAWDVVFSSLFLHHLDDVTTVAVLSHMREAARRQVLVEDLIRSRLGYGLCQVGVRLLSRSPIVHFDGPRSVEGAYRIEEIKNLAERAGLGDARFERRWPERWLLNWTRP